MHSPHPLLTSLERSVNLDAAEQSAVSAVPIPRIRDFFIPHPSSDLLEDASGLADDSRPPGRSDHGGSLERLKRAAPFPLFSRDRREPGLTAALRPILQDQPASPLPAISPPAISTKETTMTNAFASFDPGPSSAQGPWLT